MEARKWMFVLVVGFLGVAVCLTNSYAYEYKETNAVGKLTRGITNTATSPIEIVRNIYVESKYENVAYGMTIGLGKGVVQTLQKVANVLKEDSPGKDVSIEGHTDNVPIKYSGWKSNWELSTARANSILHFFVNEGGIKPERLKVAGFGEYKPVASNETEEGRQENRRVEIIILPEKISKVEAKL